MQPVAPPRQPMGPPRPLGQQQPPQQQFTGARPPSPIMRPLASAPPGIGARGPIPMGSQQQPMPASPQFRPMAPPTTTGALNGVHNSSSSSSNISAPNSGMTMKPPVGGAGSVGMNPQRPPSMPPPIMAGQNTMGPPPPRQQPPPSMMMTPRPPSQGQPSIPANPATMMSTPRPPVQSQGQQQFMATNPPMMMSTPRPPVQGQGQQQSIPANPATMMSTPRPPAQGQGQQPISINPPMMMSTPRPPFQGQQPMSNMPRPVQGQQQPMTPAPAGRPPQPMMPSARPPFPQTPSARGPMPPSPMTGGPRGPPSTNQAMRPSSPTVMSQPGFRGPVAPQQPQQQPGFRPPATTYTPAQPQQQQFTGVPPTQPQMQQYPPPGPSAAMQHPGAYPRPMMHPQQTVQQQPQATRTPRPILEQLPPIQVLASTVDQHTGILQTSPIASQAYIAHDNGHTTARFLRPTTRLIPTSSTALDEMKLPLAVLCTPFADPVPGEAPEVPMSEWAHENGPIRCTRCRGYLNCFIRASQDYSRWECSLCGHNNETPVHYRSFVQGGQPAELRFGSVEFRAPAAFFANTKPSQCNYLFVIDTTVPSIRSGLFSFSLKTILSLSRQEKFAGDAKIGIITFNETSVQFYEMLSSRPRILIAGDCEEGFSPLPASAFFISQKDHKKVEEMIQFIATNQAHESQETQQQQQTSYTNIGGAALMSAYHCLKDSGGGRILWIDSSLPNKGQGKLTDREQPGLIGTEQEQILYAADKDEKFYNDISLKCLNASIAVDIFICGSPFVDSAAIVQVPSTTGGTMERIPAFQAAVSSHRQTLELAISRACSNFRAQQVTLKARTSSGLHVSKYVGHGFPEETAFRISAISSDYCIGIELEHDGTKLEDGKSRAVFQLAILYQAVNGERRIRIHNIALQAKESIPILLHSFDTTAVALYWAKLTSLELAEASVSKVRDSLVRRLVGVLRTLRNKRIGNPPQQSHPHESLDLLTLYVLSLLKSPALLLNRPLDRGVREPYARADARILSRFRHLWMTPEKFSFAVYPALFDVTDPSTYGDPLPVVGNSISELPLAAQAYQAVRLPPRLPCSSEFLRGDGIFLLYDGSDELTLFFGSKAPSQIIEAMLGMIPPPEIKFGQVKQQALQNVCRYLIGIAPDQPVNVGLANGSSSDFFNENRNFLAKLVEDKVYAEQSYGSFVSHLHQVMESTKN